MKVLGEVVRRRTESGKIMDKNYFNCTSTFSDRLNIFFNTSFILLAVILFYSEYYDHNTVCSYCFYIYNWITV